MIAPYKVELENKKSGLRMVVEVEASSTLVAKNKAEKANKGCRSLKAQTVEEYLRMAIGG